MPLHSYLVFLAFTLMGIVLILRVAELKREGIEVLGRPSIEKYYFISGKVALFTTWALFILKALFPELGYYKPPVLTCWIATGMLWTGCFITILALISLGGSLKVGLPVSDTALQTGGIYRFSRNPLYTGIIIISLASCVYFPDLINISFMVYGIIIHHRIVKGEESFLSGRFGDEWERYRTRVRRYL